ncbi:diguanylate cyclase (GGDEF) domain-containing protein [Lachnospiraceae bacterium XBB2008]|nr:diguanylate cyclase (GGDEF) domain-containing protein [Lachnospiraceae bacterium XBB2008]
MLYKKKKGITRTAALCIVYFLLLTAFLVRVCFFTDIGEFLNARKNGLAHDYSEGWSLDSGESVDLDTVAASKYGGSMTVSKVLPDKVEYTDDLCFSTSNLKLTVYLEQTPVYSYDTKENLTGKGYGIAYHIIQLSPSDAGKTVKIEAETVFDNHKGGRFNEILLSSQDEYRYFIMRNGLAGYLLSMILIFFGLVVIFVYFGTHRKNPTTETLWALGLSSVLFGLWALADTGTPQILTGSIFLSREMVYGILHMAEFPLILFANSITKPKRRIYLVLSFLTSIISFSAILFSRYALGLDMHVMVGIIYFSYASALIWFAVILIDNEFYCRKRGLSTNLRYFYIGAMIFVISSFIDMIRYLMDMGGSVRHGDWFRLGLVIFFVFMAAQIFNWWSYEKSSLERDRFVNHLLQYITGVDDPEVKINKVLEYLCTELHAERAYIFEDMKDGTFDNTYEYCAKGVTPQIDNLKGLPYEGVVDTWYNEYRKGGHILIYDLEEYRSVSENMYQVLKPQDIHSLVTGPLSMNGEYIGFFGVDNPPEDIMQEISEIIRLLMFFLSEILLERDNRNQLIEFSYHDALTTAGNRRAIIRYEKEELDTSRPYGYMMCDINGLKSVNDSKGHEAGDEMIQNVANCLTEIFGNDGVFRMGGDEFAAYVYADSLEDFEAKVDEAKAILDEKGCCVSIGTAFASDGEKDFMKLKKEADQKMYENKRQYYSTHADRRHPED